MLCKTLTPETIPNPSLQGQKRQVEIVRLRMKDSIESRMAKMLERKYGSRHSSSDNNDGETQSDDAGIDIEKVSEEMLVGSVNCEKAKVVAAELDLLFGLEEEQQEEAPETDNEDASDMAIPDAVVSGQNESLDGETGDAECAII